MARERMNRGFGIASSDIAIPHMAPPFTEPVR
jgi:hypothetical protein